MLRLFLLISVFVMSGCTEVQYAAHMGKEFGGTLDSSPAVQQGTFKVGKPYKVQGQTYTPREQYDLVETGIASWYGPGFDGKKTANGEVFDKRELTAAHRTLQMPSLVRVTNLDNGRSVIVRINDRGPFKRSRIIDLSEKAAELLAFKGQGTAKVKLEVLQQESLRIAESARQGNLTKGYEVAANEAPGDVLETVSYDTASGSISVQPVGREDLATLPGHMRNGEFYPDPIVQERAVTRTNIFVQAGSFTVYDNAAHLKDTLSSLSNAAVTETSVNGQRFYRVRLGPVSDVNAADQLLNRVVGAGQKSAIIVVE